MPMFNAQSTLAAALDSLQKQSLTDWECVLCDDGSTDATRDIAQAYARQDRRFLPFCEPHSGLVTTLNRGLQQCRAPFIARLDADDIAARERLDAQYRFMSEHSELSGVGCGVRMFPRAML